MFLKGCLVLSLPGHRGKSTGLLDHRLLVGKIRSNDDHSMVTWAWRPLPFTVGWTQNPIQTELCPFLDFFPFSGTKAPGHGGIIRVMAEGSEGCDEATHGTECTPHLQPLGDMKDN